jgi:hypothetical protein
MQKFIGILTLAQMETSLARLEEARRYHEGLIEEEKEQATYLQAEIARVRAEGVLEEDACLARIYLGQLEYDLNRIDHNQARRVEMLEGRRKTIELFMKWDSVIAA